MMSIKSAIKSLLHTQTPDQACRDYLLHNGMKVGKNTSIYSWTTIDAGKPWLIEIGDDVIISSEVRILTHDASTQVVGCGTKLGRVSIGDHCFIGAQSTILCNVKIGNDVIVGAGSVVTRDLPSGGVYAGVPAKFVCNVLLVMMLLRDGDTVVCQR